MRYYRVTPGKADITIHEGVADGEYVFERGELIGTLGDTVFASSKDAMDNVELVMLSLIYRHSTKLAELAKELKKLTKIKKELAQ